MKYIPHEEQHGMPQVELTERNLCVLLAKLKDPLSNRTLMDPDNQITVKAVPDEEHYGDRSPGLVYMPTERRYL
jgi:hypothetical protein